MFTTLDRILCKVIEKLKKLKIKNKKIKEIRIKNNWKTKNKKNQE